MPGTLGRNGAFSISSDRGNAINHSSLVAPRLEIDLDKIFLNASKLVEKLGKRNVSVTGVTKAALGSPSIANAWLQAGVDGLGDSRIENIETIRGGNISTSVTLIRSPMLSQVDQVVRLADVSCNTELAIVKALSAAARKADRSHGIILMVELGDLREGIMPELLEGFVAETLRLPNLNFEGIGANLACRSGVSPDSKNMAVLSALADKIDATFGTIVTTVSGGNSANLNWALSGVDTGRINNLRLGEALLLGREPLHRQALDELHTDAITLIAEVIESKIKPTQPWGEIAQAAFGETRPKKNTGSIIQSILAIGRQDIDPSGLDAPLGISILAASSDHLIIDSSKYRRSLKVGDPIPFQLNYSALLRAMTSPFITKVTKRSNRFPKSLQPN
ncbi:alanine/ornithine racemase family PLP-dependent enzyme [Puniceicoccaceae bacterium K14]|nr:alanine/ornithine racemase family PLP-dependent enzyme [Puniceicoccaceae bacterium K14]